MVMSDRWRMSPGLRRTSAVVAIAALAIGGAKIASDHTMPGTGFSTVQTAAADPTGPGGPTGGPGMDGGQQFQPPQMPAQQPDYQGGNQPPLNQDNGVSIYNSGAPQAPQQGGQQGAQQQPGNQQPQHGSQIPDYQSNPGYTQGPGKPNPDVQAPQQQSPQQPQQGQQPQQQQPSQNQQPQNKQDDTTQQLDQQQQQRQQQCMSAAQDYGIAEQMLSFMASAFGGVGSMFQQPSRKVGPGGECNCAPEQAGPQDSEPSPDQQQPPRSDQKINCEPPTQGAVGDDLDSTIPNTNINIGGDPKESLHKPPQLNGSDNPLNSQLLPKDQRPIPTGTALGPQGKQYAFYSTPQYHNPGGSLNENYVTPNSAIVDLANPSKIIGNSPLAQTSGAYDPASNTMLLAGNPSATPGDGARELWQSSPIDPKNPNSWINNWHKIGNLMPGDRESQLIALGQQGKDGFLFVGSRDKGPIEAVLASTPQELTQKLAGQTLVQNPEQVAGVYGPTITSQTLDSATGTGSLGLRVSQFWDPLWKAANPDNPKVPYDPRVYNTTCTVQ
ncbi:hypothetical protein [Mycobacterium sp. NPDC050853]|uniref:hypothetical protein n=1 Tax=Mycobacterium sp. NPDC050853 TaxID=3155160 RepID=UPI0033E5F616